MNRLLKKLKEFGLILSIPQTDSQRTISLCHSLKRADIPVLMVPYSQNSDINQVKVSNENEDLFIGARCSGAKDDIKGAVSSGAHFIILPYENNNLISDCLSDGLDIIVEAESIEQIDQLRHSGVEALLIDSSLNDYEILMNYAIENSNLFLFLRGTKEGIPLEKWRNNNRLIAFIIDDFSDSPSADQNYADALNLINRLLGLKFISLTIKPDTERADEARTFAALSTIPLFTGGKEDILRITVDDMDRAIAYMKWRNIYMDPFSAKMQGDIIVETDLYTEFLGWKVKLINSQVVFPAD